MRPKIIVFRIIHSTLPVAIRVYPESNEPAGKSLENHLYEIPPMPKALFIVDTETRTAMDQRLMFGSARFVLNGRCQEEVLFYADDLPVEDRVILEQYVANHKSAVADSRPLRLLSRTQFLKKLYSYAYKSRVPIVGVNLPFDLSRLAFDVTDARGKYAGGFSLAVWNYGFDRNQYRPPISIVHIDSKRALIGFRSRRSPDLEDLIPEEWKDGTPDPHYIFPGYFIDLRTLGYALTAKAGTLESMCDDFRKMGYDIAARKLPVKQHGVITEDYINYNRNDVQMTAELAKAMLAEFDRHGLDRPPSKVFSIASIGKAYLRKMGIEPVLTRQPDFPKKFLGYAQSAFTEGEPARTFVRFQSQLCSSISFRCTPRLTAL
jgi:hypothetical protein